MSPRDCIRRTAAIAGGLFGGPCPSQDLIRPWFGRRFRVPESVLQSGLHRRLQRTSFERTDEIQLTGDVTLTAVDDTIDGNNGLPSIASDVTIQGAGGFRWTIARDALAPEFRIFHVPLGGTLTLEDVGVSGGALSVSTVSLHDIGGGILNNGGTVNLIDSTVSGNSAAGGGGVTNRMGATLNASNTMFSGNSATFSGGAISNQTGATLTMSDSTVSGNFVTSGLGAGINNISTATLINCTVSGNSATPNDGGGIENVDARPAPREPGRRRRQQ